MPSEAHNLCKVLLAKWRLPVGASGGWGGWAFTGRFFVMQPPRKPKERSLLAVGTGVAWSMVYAGALSWATVLG